MRIQISPPINLSAKNKVVFERFTFYEVVEPCIKEYNNIYITRSGIGLKNFSLVKDTIHPWGYATRYFLKYALVNFVFRKTIKLKKEKYILIHNHWSKGYFHWLMEAMHRLWLAKDLLHECILLFPEDYSSPFYNECLEPFGVKRKFIIPKKSGVKVENLIIPATQLGEYHPQITNDIRKLYHDYLFKNKHHKNFGERIYVSRKKANQRKVENEDEVIELLKKYDFNIIYFEDCSFWDEVSIMYYAKYFITIHGAGIANIQFMHANGHVLELYKELNDPQNDLFIREYLFLASILGLKYYTQFCPSMNKNESSFKANIFVDLSELQDNVELMLSNK